jgi:hypothetical protein
MPGLDLSARGAGIPYGSLRDLLVRCKDPAVVAVVADYDADLEHAARLNADRPTPPADVDAAYRAEALAAALERREPTLSSTSVQTAQAAAVDHATNAAAAQRAIGARNAQLAAVIAARSPALLPILAVERQRMLDAGEDVTQHNGAVATLYRTIVWPPLRWGWGCITNRGDRQWWYPNLGVPLWDPHAEIRCEWEAWAWSQLALGDKGIAMTDKGALMFRHYWAPPAARPGVGRAGIAVAGRARPAGESQRGVEPGAVVLLGIGPNGEQGVTDEDLRWKFKPVTYG